MTALTTERPDRAARDRAARARRQHIADQFERLLVCDYEDVSWLLGRQLPDRRTWLWLDGGRWFLLGRTPPHGDAAVGMEVVNINEPLGLLIGSADLAVAGSAPDAVLQQLHGNRVTSGDVLASVRACKDEVEQALIADNACRLGRALGAVPRELRPGVTELELWSVYAQALQAPGEEDEIELAGNLAGGLRTLEPDPHVTGRQVRSGDILLLDAYPRIGGYHADLTRTWVCGAGAERIQHVHEGVLAALRAVASRLRPGAVGGELDDVARSELERRGLPADFPHHTGHGFGVRQQEPPWLKPGSSDVIEESCVIAVEPACYLQGLGGVRLEQDFVVTSDGARELGPPMDQYSLQAR